MVLNFFTWYISDIGEEVMEHHKVAIAYMKGWFLIDLCSSVPLDLIFKSGAAGAASSARLLKAGKALKVLKMARLSKLVKLTSGAYADRIEEALATPELHTLATGAKLVGATFFSCHFIACIWGWAALQGPAAGQVTWMFDLKDGDDSDDDGEEDDGIHPNGDGNGPVWLWKPHRRYVTCVYWSMTTVTTVGYGDIVPESDTERIVAIFCMMIGTLVYSFIIGSVSSIVASTDANQRNYLDKVRHAA